MKIIQHIHFKFDGFWQTDVPMEPLSCSRKKNISGTPDGPLCPFAVSPPTAVISDLGPVSVDRFFSSRISHKWNPRVCTFSLTQRDAFESYPYCCHVSGICTTLVRSTYSFEWICHNPIYLFTSWWTFDMFSIWGLLRTKLLQASPFCGLML